MELDVELTVLSVIGWAIFFSLAYVVYGVLWPSVRCRALWNALDDLFEQRHVELPRLVAIAESYPEVEPGVFKKIREARHLYSHAETFESKVEAYNALSSAIGHFLSVADQYPTLKKQRGFVAVPERLIILEHALKDAANQYNLAVTHFNNRILKAPYRFAALVLRVKAKPMVTSEIEENTDVNLRVKRPA